MDFNNHLINRLLIIFLFFVIKSICNTDIGDSALSSMLSILGNNQILRSLTLSQVNLTRNCKACLVNYLISDNSLTSLNLSENKYNFKILLLFMLYFIFIIQICK